MTYPIISPHQHIQAFYEQCRESGESHTIAEICALQQHPGIDGTDSQFWRGRWEHMENMHPVPKAMYEYEAKRAGLDTKGKFYMSSLAQFPGDPRAWVSDRHDILKLCEERNYDAEGLVRHKADMSRCIPDEGNVPLADDLVHECIEQAIEQNPELKFTRSYSDLADEMRDKHSYKTPVVPVSFEE